LTEIEKQHYPQPGDRGDGGTCDVYQRGMLPCVFTLKTNMMEILFSRYRNGEGQTPLVLRIALNLSQNGRRAGTQNIEARERQRVKDIIWTDYGSI